MKMNHCLICNRMIKIKSSCPSCSLPSVVCKGKSQPLVLAAHLRGRTAAWEKFKLGESIEEVIETYLARLKEHYPEHVKEFEQRWERAGKKVPPPPPPAVHIPAPPPTPTPPPKAEPRVVTPVLVRVTPEPPKEKEEPLPPGAIRTALGVILKPARQPCKVDGEAICLMEEGDWKGCQKTTKSECVYTQSLKE